MPMAPEAASPNVFDPKAEKRFDVSVDTRNLEIDLFWKRSLFFWGFIASAFVGFATLRNSSQDLAIIIACFGTVCSVAWSLLNRGSKYWQESWETKVEESEKSITGNFFATEEATQSWKGPWLCARKYSVSKLAIALSDYVAILWLTLVVGELVRRFAPLPISQSLEPIGVIAFTSLSVVYVFLMLKYGKKSPRPQ
ncbi:MAG: hypothetical protein ACRD3W_25980 [Terriglobales bacterium]